MLDKYDGHARGARLAGNIVDAVDDVAVGERGLIAFAQALLDIDDE